MPLPQTGMGMQLRSLFGCANHLPTQALGPGWPGPVPASRKWTVPWKLCSGAPLVGSGTSTAQEREGKKNCTCWGPSLCRARSESLPCFS